jgi:hypothetical protein
MLIENGFVAPEGQSSLLGRLPWFGGVEVFDVNGEREGL